MNTKSNQLQVSASKGENNLYDVELKKDGDKVRLSGCSKAELKMMVKVILKVINQ